MCVNAVSVYVAVVCVAESVYVDAESVKSAYGKSAAESVKSVKSVDAESVKSVSVESVSESVSESVAESVGKSVSESVAESVSVNAGSVKSVSVAKSVGKSASESVAEPVSKSVVSVGGASSGVYSTTNCPCLSRIVQNVLLPYIKALAWVSQLPPIFLKCLYKTMLVWKVGTRATSFRVTMCCCLSRGCTTMSTSPNLSIAS